MIIGCGSIGTVIARAADEMNEIEKILLFDIDREKAQKLRSKLSKSESVSEVSFDVDLIIEAAGQQAAKEYIPAALEAGKDSMIMSVGAFVDEDFQQRCFKAVSSRGAQVIIPSGAVAGVDALRSASKATLDEVLLTTTKPPKGLSGVKYLIEKGIEVEKLKTRTVLYSGPASQAVQYFPANVNVAATVSLAGIGFERTRVEVICDPEITVNSHRLFARGAFGEFEAVTRNLPSPDNPKTSYLASLSAVSALRSYISRIWIGV
jgi:aspartate dehydrogenase